MQIYLTQNSHTKNNFNNFIDEKNPKLIEIYKQRAEEYLTRAAYIKK